MESQMLSYIALSLDVPLALDETHTPRETKKKISSATRIIPTISFKPLICSYNVP
jgi:hypothetical protein